MGWDVTVGSDNADNFAKFCQAQKLQFTIRDGLGKVICRLGCVLAQTMLTICNLSLCLRAHKSHFAILKNCCLDAELHIVYLQFQISNE